MAIKTKKINWRAQYRDFERQGLGITGHFYRVLDVEYGQEDQLGYTSSKKTIHTNPHHELVTKLKEELEQISLIKGVYAHELLHQIFTDFDVFEKKMNFVPPAQRPIFGVINNVLEDAAIENFAPQVMGGTMLASLNFSIAHIYKNSPKLEEATSAFSQYIAALINFGDMGPLKGEFTFPEARRVFIQTAPLFEAGVYETCGKKRIEIAAKIMEIARPLWEDIAKKNEEMEKFLEEFSKQLKSQMRGSGSGRDAEVSEDGGKKSSRRKITIKKVSKEELEEMKKNGEVSEGDGSGKLPDGDLTLIVCEDEDEKSSSGNGTPIDGDIVEENDKGKENDKTGGNDSNDTEEDDTSGKSNSANKDSDAEKDTSSNSNSDSEDSKANKTAESETDNPSDKSSDSDSSKEQNGDNGKNNPFTTSTRKNAERVENQPTPEGFEETDEENDIGEIAEDEYLLSESDLERIAVEVEQAEEVFKKEEKDETSTVAIDNFDVTSPKLGRKSCLNYRVTYDSSDRELLETRYSEVMSRLSPGIKSLTTQLKRIFENDREEIEYRTSGRINLKRANSGRVTARVFNRRVSPANKSNFSVELLVDESGSMSGGGKATAARECCIALAEVFGNLGIPVYVIGFTADTKGYDIVHNHYITWKNSHSERLKLLNITARANNCDGYSVRYATEVLKKSKTENKLLIVLSDGQPAAHNYYDGVPDTKQAIRDAKKHSNVLGVAIGNSDTETIFHMYEKDFLHIGDVEDLFAGLSRTLQKMMKQWGDR